MLKRSALVFGLAVFGTAPLASAALCDLTVINSTCTINGAIFTNDANALNIGSGIITPFLTTQQNGTEAGFSTDVPAVTLLPLNDKRDNANTFTNTLALDNIGVVSIGGLDYVKLFLDVNEPANADSLISLDVLKIYDTGSALPFLVGGSTTLAQLDTMLAALIRYDLGNNSILLDANIFKGSGIGYDMEALIPLSDFDTTPVADRLVVATQFGLAGGNAGTADGFEEWAALRGTVAPPPPPPLPEPATLTLVGAGIIGLRLASRRRDKKEKP